MPDFNPDKSKRIWQLDFEGAWPTACAFVGSGRRLAAGNREGLLFLWDLPDEPPKDDESEEDKKKRGRDKDALPTAPPARQLVGHDNGVTHLIAAPDGKTLISASLDHTIRFWDCDAAPTGEAEVVMDAEARQRAAKRDKNAPVPPPVKVKTQQAAQVLEGHDAWINALGISGDGKRLISGDDNGRVIVWDLATRKKVTQWTGYPGDWASTASLSFGGDVAFVGEYCASRGDFDRPPAQARLWNALDGKEMIDVLAVQFPDEKDRGNSYGWAQKWGKFMGRGFVASAFSPDDTLVAAGQGGETDKGRVHLIDVKTGKVVRTVGEHQYGVTDLAFAAMGKYLLTCGRDTRVCVHNVDDGKEIASLGKPRGGQFKDWFYALTLSPDNTRLAATDIAGMVHVWQFGQG